MKIAFILGNYPSPGDTFITNQITGLLDRKHEVRIFALAPSKGMTTLHEDVVKYNLQERTFYYGKPSDKREFLCSAINEFLTHPVLTSGRLLRSLNPLDFGSPLQLSLAGEVAGGINLPYRTVNAFFTLMSFEKMGPFEVFNPHFGPIANRMLFLKRMYPSATYVASFHGYDFSTRIRIFGKDYYKRLFCEADLITTHSFYARDCLVDIGCPPDKIIKHPLGIDIDRFAFKSRSWSPREGDLRFVMVARLVDKKGHRILLNAFERLAKKRPNVAMHLVGSGHLEDQIRARVSESDTLRQRVVLHGWKTQNEVVRLLDQCHVFVHPSITEMRWAEQEDTPTSILEAQAMGLPVIGTFHAGIPEIVDDGRTGLLVPERNEAALCNSMLRFVDEPGLMTTMGEAGRRFAADRFDIRRLNCKLERVFQKLREGISAGALGIESTQEI